jgi:hypothetical protein
MGVAINLQKGQSLRHICRARLEFRQRKTKRSADYGGLANRPRSSGYVPSGTPNRRGSAVSKYAQREKREQNNQWSLKCQK